MSDQLSRLRLLARSSIVGADLKWLLDEYDRQRAALEQIRDYHVIQGMSPELFAGKVLAGPAVPRSEGQK